jgi:hypothetical protein
MLIDVLAFLFGALLLLEDHIKLILVWDHILVRPPFLTRHIIGWFFFFFNGLVLHVTLESHTSVALTGPRQVDVKLLNET